MDTKEKLLDVLSEAWEKRKEFCVPHDECETCPYDKYPENCHMYIMFDHLIANGVTVLPESGIGDMSDGYHTFNELYHHRAVLFSVICNLHPLCAWKAKKHHDGSMYDGMFIVGINTPEGQATYHYDIDPYWDMFRVPEAEFAPEWDGHTPDESIRRIGLLGTDCPVQRWIPVTEQMPEFHVNEDGIDCTHGIIVFRSDWDKTVHIGYCVRSVWYDACAGVDIESHRWYDAHGDRWEDVTHWMPLPEPPKGE